MSADESKISELRLLRLEEAQSETDKVVAGHGEAIRFISKALDEMPQRVSQHLELTLNPMAQDISDLKQVEDRVQALGERVGEHGSFIEREQAARRAAADRKDTWRKAWLTVVTGAVAIFAKEGATWLIKHWPHLH